MIIKKLLSFKMAPFKFLTNGYYNLNFILASWNYNFMPVSSSSPTHSFIHLISGHILNARHLSSLWEDSNEPNSQKNPAIKELTMYWIDWHQSNKEVGKMAVGWW